MFSVKSNILWLQKKTVFKTTMQNMILQNINQCIF